MLIKPLVLHDKIYGDVKINSPVVLELLNSNLLARLKNIGQFGVPDEFYHLKNYSRFKHSLGVMILLKKLGASEEEQIAGLLHDISHTAFSHVIDWVVGDSEISENYQDNQHKDYILNKKIIKILKKYNYDPYRFLKHENFLLLEKDIPDTCADRIDYALREFPLKLAKRCFAGMNATKNEIIFNNKDVAFLFASSFLNRNIKHWGGYEAVTRYRLFANVLRIALRKEIILFSDFKKDDRYIKNKLIKSTDKKIKKILSVLENKSLKNLPKGNKIAHKKFRYVDPLILKNGRLYKLSEIDLRFKNLVEKTKEINKRGIRLPKITALE